MPEITVIIVNYKVPKLICDCINAIYTNSNKFFDLEILIVDNNSNDNSYEIISAKYPLVKWLQMGYNAGFARANNKGINESSTQIVLLLNPDTLILDNAIEKCFQRLKESNFIAASVQLLNVDYSKQITGNFFMKGGLNHLLPIPYMGSLFRKIALAVKMKKTNVPSASIEEKVDWINGAFMMLKKKAIEKAGMFDEDFFLYAEEIEWCSRLRKVGEICVFGDLHTIHIQGESIGKATQTVDKGYFNLYDKKGLQLIVSQMVRIRKQFGKAWFLLHLFLFTLEIPIFFLCSTINSLIKLKNPFIEWKLAKGFTKNVFKTWGLFWVILLNKPHFYKMF